MTKKIFLLVLASIILFTHLEMFFMPVGTDEGMFFHIGQQIAQGHLPYRDAWEHKPPVAFYIFAGVLKISNTNTALVLFELFWTFLTAYFLYLLAQYFLNKNQAQLAAYIYAFAANAHRITQGGNQTEVYMVLFSILLYYFFWRFYREKKSIFLFCSGIMGGIAFQTKPVACFSVAAVVLFMFYDFITNKRRRNLFLEILIFGLGFLLPNLLLLAYFFHKGILRDFITLNYGYNFMYISRNAGSALRLMWLKDTILDNAVSLAFLWILVLVSLINYKKILITSKQNIFLFIILFFDALGVALGFKFHGHYYIQLMPALAILSVIGYGYLNKNKHLRRLIIGLIVLAVLVQAGFSAKEIYKKTVLKKPDVNKLTGEYLQKNTTLADRLYVQGTKPSIYFYANRSIVWNVETDNILRRLNDKMQKKYENIMKRNPPKFIVITERENILPWQPEFIKQNYRLATKINTYEIYRRK